jgi:hypothetical protein
LRRICRFLAAALLPVAAVSCGDDSDAAGSSSEIPPALQFIFDSQPAPRSDTFEVFVCDVPQPTTDPIFGTMTLRLDLDPAELATIFDDRVQSYFETLSHDLYHPTFVAGRVLQLTADETHDDCVARALDSSADTTSAVLVIANAEHLETAPGGWGEQGRPCASTFCPARATRRYAYVGASDFSPDYGAVPLLDLVEHEIGHALGLPHSGGGGADVYSSDLDLMSNSAAPREVQPDRRDGQDTLAVNRLGLGWLPRSAVAVAGPDGGRYTLAASAGTAGRRLLVLPLDDDSFLTVEYLTNDGLDDFLPMSGLAVHKIDQSPGACGPAATNGGCTGEHREQITLGSPRPHVDLLHDKGAAWHVDGWSITVLRAGAVGNPSMQVEVHRTDG